MLGVSFNGKFRRQTGERLTLDLDSDRVECMNEFVNFMKAGGQDLSDVASYIRVLGASYYAVISADAAFLRFVVVGR